MDSHSTPSTRKPSDLCHITDIYGILVAEAVGGILANSLALLSDAAHMFGDVFALSHELVRDQNRLPALDPDQNLWFSPDGNFRGLLKRNPAGVSWRDGFFTRR